MNIKTKEGTPDRIKSAIVGNLLRHGFDRDQKDIHREQLSPEEFKATLEALQDNDTAQSVEENFKLTEEFYPGIDHKVPRFITKDNSIAKAEDIKPGDQAVFLCTLHTVDEEGFLVDDQDGLVACVGGYHCTKGTPGCSAYIFDRNTYGRD